MKDKFMALLEDHNILIELWFALALFIVRIVVPGPEDDINIISIALLGALTVIDAISIDMIASGLNQKAVKWIHHLVTLPFAAGIVVLFIIPNSDGKGIGMFSTAILMSYMTARALRGLYRHEQNNPDQYSF